MGKAGRFAYNVTKGFYDILATYLLLWVLYITVVSLGLHAVFSLLATHLEYETLELMWIVAGRKSGIDPVWIRLALYGGLQLGILYLLYGPMRFVFTRLEKVFDRIQQGYLWLGAKIPGFKKAFGVCFTLTVTALLIPAVIQPTLVPMRVDKDTMIERAANLADGQATLGFADSVVGFYRRLYEKPEPIGGVPNQELDRVFSKDPDVDYGKGYGTLSPPDEKGAEPMMDRWDPYIWEAAAKDPKQYAFIKAFMKTESGGRQFAVSRTGCMGLMQFCSGTARSDRFKNIFGTGQVYTCRCNGPCKIDRTVQRDMERGDPTLIEKHSKSKAFPCEITDGRLNAPKAINAGSKYVSHLRQDFGDNIYLMYIGYNSGPAVARKVYAALGKNSEATLEEIEVHLASSMYQWYGDKSERRARSLLRIHLPKIKKAYDRYYASTQKVENVSSCPMPTPEEDTSLAMMPADMPEDIAMRIEELEYSREEEGDRS